MPDERFVTMVTGGPILVEGPVEITLDDGRVVRSTTASWRRPVRLPTEPDLSVLRHQLEGRNTDVESH